MADAGLWTFPSVFCVVGATLDMPCCVLLANRVVGPVSPVDKAQIAWQVCDIVRVSFCMTGAACGEFFCVVSAYFGHFTHYTST